MKAKYPRLAKYWSRHPYQRKLTAIPLIFCVCLAGTFFVVIESLIEGARHAVELFCEDLRAIGRDVRDLWEG